MKPLRIALAQINGIVGDLAGNSERAAELIAKAQAGGANLVVFPQFVLEGWPAGDLLHNQAFIGAAAAARDQLVRQIAGPSVVFGSIVHDDEGYADSLADPAQRPDHQATGSGLPRIAAIAVHDGRILATGEQERLEIGTPIADQRRFFSSGREGEIFQVQGWRVGVTIGDDIRPENGVVQRLVERGVDLILNLDARPFEQKGGPALERRLIEVAREYGVHIGYVNRAGGQDEFVLAGSSMVITPVGEIAARARAMEEDLVLADLTSSGAEATPPLPYDEVAETYRAITIGIRDYVRANGFRRVTLGLSGGIDSALVATLAVDALGPEAVTAAWLPSPYSSELSRRDAFGLAENLGIDLLSLPIAEPMRSFQELLRPDGSELPGLTEENLQARIRGTILMALANENGWLLLSTSNKSETAVGYTTLYGDMAGGLAPLRDLYKTTVYELARWRNQKGEVIPESTITRPPTAELRPDQLDTDSLPDYDILDPILRGYLEEGLSAEDLIGSGADPDLVGRIIGLVERGEFKRRQGPPGIKVTPYAFGVDDLRPMTSRFRGT